MALNHKNIAVPTLLTIFGLAVIVTVVYMVGAIRNRERSADDLLNSASNLVNTTGGRSVEQIMADLASARSTLQVEIARLSELRRASGAESVYLSALRIEYGTAEDALFKNADALFNNARSKNPTIRIGVSSTVQASINASRAHITDILNAWQTLLNGPQTSTTINTIHGYEKALQDYLKQLENLVHGLTPENSGLTPQEIVRYQDDVNGAIDQVKKIIDVTADAITPNPNPTTTPPVGSGQQVDIQQKVVDDLQDQVDHLEDELIKATSTPPINPIITPVNPGILIDIITNPILPGTEYATSGKPKLIQGANYDY